MTDDEIAFFGKLRDLNEILHVRIDNIESLVALMRNHAKRWRFDDALICDEAIRSATFDVQGELAELKRISDVCDKKLIEQIGK